MQLNHTNQTLRALRENNVFGDYAVLVRYQGEKQLLTSPGVNGDTYFDNASMGKILITSPLILRAIGEGKISLDTTLDACFRDACIPEVPEDKKSITIQQILTHSSGIVRYEFAPEVAQMDHDAVAKEILSRPLAYAPGTSYTYSCHGYILLGFLAEKLYGARLDTLFETILKPALGLTRSRFNIAGNEPNAVVCYSRREMGAYRADDSNVRLLHGVAGSGASFSTAYDMERYADAIFRKDAALYAPYLYELAEKDYTPNYAEGRGLGYLMPDDRYSQTGRLFPKGSFGHCGHTGQSLFLNREMDLYVILLTNTTRYSNLKNDYRGYDYNVTCRMRETVHNAIAEDIL